MIGLWGLVFSSWRLQRYGLGACGAQVMLVAGVWGFRFCCAARGVMPCGGRRLVHAFELTNIRSVRGQPFFSRAWPLWPTWWSWGLAHGHDDSGVVYCVSVT